MQVNTYIPISDPLPQFIDMITEIHDNDNSVTITKNGAPETIVMSMEQLESIQETMEILADESALKQLRASIREEQEGKDFIDLEDIL
jgi:antitoxin YefM